MSKKIDYNSYWQIDENPISRTGIFPYLGRQISPLLEPNKVYDVLRPEEELFSQETMNSFKLKPLVNDHCMLGEDFTPAEKHGIHGVLGERIGRKGDFLVANMEIYSETIKNEIRNGKKELSLGYFCDYDLTPGTYRGRHYDAVQRNLRGNHIALVDKGRMGHDVRVMDGMRSNDAKNVLVYDEMPFMEGMTGDSKDPDFDKKHPKDKNDQYFIEKESSGTAESKEKEEETENNNENAESESEKKQDMGEENAESNPNNSFKETALLNPKITEALKTTPDKLANGVIFALTGNPVASITGNEFPKTEKHIVDDVAEYYQKEYGGKITHPELGDILLDYKGVKNDYRHGIGRLKCASFICVPQVILKGQIYAVEKNRKGKGYDTYCIIAPVEINGKRYIEEVIIKSSKEKNRLYLHEVEIKEKLEDLFLREPQTQGNKNLPASKLSIAEKIAKSKSETANDFNSGETEKAAAKEKGMKDEKESKNPPEAADPGEEKKARPEEESATDKKSCDGGKTARIAEILKGKTDEQTIAAVMEALGQPDDTEEAGDGDEQKAEGKKEKEPEAKDKKPEVKEEGKTAKKEASAEDAALSDSVFDRLEAEIASRIAARDALVSRLKPIIGEFKGEAMTKRQVIEYACDALSLTEKTEKALTACLDRKEAEGTAYVKGGASNHSVIERFLKGE